MDPELDPDQGFPITVPKLNQKLHEPFFFTYWFQIALQAWINDFQAPVRWSMLLKPVKS